MKRRNSAKKRTLTVHDDSVLSWLPFDSRLIPPIFAFGHVKGAAKIFLQIEMILSVLIVIGTCILVIVRLLS